MSFLTLEQSIKLAHHRDIVKAINTRITVVHQRPLHDGQIKIAKAFFNEKKRIIQSQWGRSAGKTECVLYIAYTYALLNDGVLVYIICPQLKQGRKIYWTSRRLQDYGPPEYILNHRDSDLIVELKNGSKICVEGQENYNALRGIKPNLVFYDEFQDHSREFDLEVMRPNLIAKKSSLIITGTPPKKRSAYYVEFRDLLLQEVNGGDDTRLYLEMPSSANPSLDQGELDKIEKQLIKSGNETLWKREYLGQLVFGGEGSVFPKWAVKTHVRPHEIVLSFIQKKATSMKWYTICDPGNTGCFAVLFVAYNPLTAQFYILDEIYEKDPKKTDAKSMWTRIKEKQRELFPNAPKGTWKTYYDEAASWFYREIQANFHEPLFKTDKNNSDPDEQISLIKIMMAEEDCLFVSSRCKWLAWEIDSYVTDENGNYPDENDHLIDCFRYGVSASAFKFLHKAYDPSEKGSFQAEGKMVHTVSTKNSEWSDNVTEWHSDLGDSYDDHYDA